MVQCVFNIFMLYIPCLINSNKKSVTPRKHTRHTDMGDMATNIIYSAAFVTQKPAT